MEFIVEIPDERLSKNVRECMYKRVDHPMHIKSVNDFTILELAKVFISNNWGEITNIKLMEE